MQHMTLVTGHRGAAGLKPENTLAGFRAAVALGADFVECDVHLSRDNEVVVIHDETLDRTTDRKGAIRGLTLAEIREADAGGGERVPTLDEVLDAVTPRARLLCELKNDTVVPAAVARVRARGLLERVTFISFNVAALALARAQGPDVKLGYLLFHPSEADIAFAQYLKAESIDMDYRRACYHVIRAIQGAGLLARCWTPNDPREFTALAALGIDAITTDRPDLLLKHLGRGLLA